MRSKADGYEYPLYRKPPNLLPGGRMAVAGAPAAERRQEKEEARQAKARVLLRRAAIDDGVLAGRDLEICWLKDPIDSFFIHIQGSVRVLLDDGKLMRLNYEAANGHPYYAVGRYLIDRNIVPKDEMSMDRIREWMERNPEEGKELRRRTSPMCSSARPIWPPTRSRSARRAFRSRRAARSRSIASCTPMARRSSSPPMLPIESLKPDTPFRRLMIAQDTGGAIVGPARADIYFGAGDEAASVSGRLRHDGRFVMLVPKELVPVAATTRFRCPGRGRPIDGGWTACRKTVEAAKEEAEPKHQVGKPAQAGVQNRRSKSVRATKAAAKKPGKKADKPAAKTAEKKAEKSRRSKREVREEAQAAPNPKPETRAQADIQVQARHDPTA